MHFFVDLKCSVWLKGTHGRSGKPQAPGELGRMAADAARVAGKQKREDVHQILDQTEHIARWVVAPKLAHDIQVPTNGGKLKTAACEAASFMTKRYSGPTLERSSPVSGTI